MFERKVTEASNERGTNRRESVEPAAEIESSSDTSRRRFLQGSSTLAASSVLFGGFVGSTEAVPDTPDAESTTRRFEVHAIDVDIAYNAFGLHNPRGVMYVLEENLDAVNRAEGERPGESAVDTSVIEPLVIRANKGDIVEIEFHNDLEEGKHASIHQTALPYEADTSDGMAVGYNANTTVAPGDSTTYQWYAAHEGTHFFMDGANQSKFSLQSDDPGRANLLARGLFGAIVVEPPGAAWRDPETGAELRSGTKAIIETADGEVDHREFAIFYHDAEGAVIDGGEPEGEHVTALNYRAEQTDQRVRGAGEPKTAFYSSWLHGDPGGGDTVFPAYTGDPVKIVAIGAQTEENHVHHLHAHRWKEAPVREDGSDTIDSQTVGPGATFPARLVAAHGEGTSRPNMSFEEAFDVGAGYVHEGTGDYLFHCHMFPHYAEGMNGIMRVFDKEQDDLALLPNNSPPVDGDDDRLGFPEFISGEDGEVAPKPPDRREQAETETGDYLALESGAPYADPCDVDDDVDGVTREYTVVALETDIVYNDAGDHDPDGLIYVLEEDADAVRNGEINPEPLVIRANVGDCVHVTLKNELDKSTDPERVDQISMHPHFVGFDVLGSDGADVGYNYGSGVEPGEEGQYRWYADEEGAIYFHDHMIGVNEVMHGIFGAIIVEPAGSTWLDPHTGEEIRSGTQAMIVDHAESDFRENVLLYHDFAPLQKSDGGFVTDERQHGVNAGVSAINYRNAPYYRRRRGADPAYVHSSYRHGDPATPVFESYPDDPIRVRLIQGAYEEQHNFAIHGLKTNPEGQDPADSVSNIIGPSEGFTFRMKGESPTFGNQTNPDGLPVRDYLYGSMILDDLWNGMWGIHRVFGSQVDHLQPLPDRGGPAGRIPEQRLSRMGHPAPFDNRRERGQRAKLDANHVDARRNQNIRGPDGGGTGRGREAYPPTAADPGNPAPNAEARVYNVTAFQTDIEYNEYGDHDPHGIVFALDEHVEDIRSGERPAKPLTIRANRGDIVEVNLTNDLPSGLEQHADDPQLRAEQAWPRSDRISLHPQRLTYDVQGSDGATVGFNYDQTIAPGDTLTYRWYARDEAGDCVVWDMADTRGHRHHGSFGNVIVEPEGSTWLHQETGEPLYNEDPGTGHAVSTARHAIIKRADGSSFREYSLLFSDGMHIVNDSLGCVVPAGGDHEQDAGDPCNQLGDPEDQGFGAINNRSEPFRRRFNTGSSDPHRVYSSDEHGDPNTDVLNAYVGDEVAFRVAQGGCQTRGVSFHLSGHQWPRFRGVNGSPIQGVDDVLNPGKSIRVDPVGGAGGVTGETGDFLYQELKQRGRLESGMWGLFRVGSAPDDFETATQPTPENAGAVALDDRPGWNVTRGDVTGDGTDDVLISVSASDIRGVNAGAAYLFEGPVDESEITDLAIADAAFFGEDAKRQARNNAEPESDAESKSDAEPEGRGNAGRSNGNAGN